MLSAMVYFSRGGPLLLQNNAGNPGAVWYVSVVLFFVLNICTKNLLESCLNTDWIHLFVSKCI